MIVPIIFTIFTAEKNLCILHGKVFVMERKDECGLLLFLFSSEFGMISHYSLPVALQIASRVS